MDFRNVRALEHNSEAQQRQCVACPVDRGASQAVDIAERLVPKMDAKIVLDP